MDEQLPAPSPPPMSTADAVRIAIRELRLRRRSLSRRGARSAGYALLLAELGGAVEVLELFVRTLEASA